MPEFKKPHSLTDVPFHYCPGCTHGIVHRLVAEVIDEMGIEGETIGVCPVGCSFESDLVSGRYAVDAKSIMGIFSLDLAKPLEFIVHDDSAKADELLDAVLKFRA